MNHDPSILFESLADRFAQELRTGLSPDVEQYALENPELADRIHKLFPVLRMMEQRQPGAVVDESALLESELRQLKNTPPLRQLGDYRIIREIGRGGMGIVYEAEQESLGRHVALKVLPNTVQFDERRRQRFHQEARAAAMLHHTNIIPVFGVGNSDELSYFVMQYIEGRPLDDVLRELSDVSPDELLAGKIATLGGHATLSTVASGLFSDAEPDNSAEKAPPTHQNNSGSTNSSSSVNSQTLSHDQNNVYWRSVARIGKQVAGALAHAHAHGVLHRDIKPSNLLLDAEGSVWVTDFGLAKNLESPDLTRTGEYVGTLRYMSPEHLCGKADERSDIFGLGLTLYELASLQPGYAATDRNELLKQVGEGSIKSVRSVNRHIPRDLSTIITKCLEHDPGQRYTTAELLEKDLTRFLAGEPILARQTSYIERSIKWCQRRPAIAALLSALLLSLVAGIAGVSWQWQKTADALSMANTNLATSNQQAAIAKKHFLQARDAVNRFYTITSQQRLLAEPGLQPLRKELMEQALVYHKQFADQYRDDDGLKAELGNSLYQIARIEGEIIASPEQHLSLDEPIRIFEELSASDPENPEYPVWLARCLGLKSKFLRRSNARDSMDLMTEAADLIESNQEYFHDELLGGEELARFYQELGLAWESIGRATQETEKSLEYYGKARDLRVRLQNAWPDQEEHSILIAALDRDLGITYCRMGNYDDAERSNDDAMVTLIRVVTDNPDSELARRTLGSVANSVGYYYGSGGPVKNYDRALECYALSRDQYQALADNNPLVVEFQDGLARASLNEGAIYQVQRNLEAALNSRTAAHEIRERLVNANPDATYLRSSWALTLNGVGATLRDMDRLEESMVWHHLADEQHQIAINADPEQPVLRMRMVDGLVQKTRTLTAMNRYSEAVDVLESIDEFTRPEFSQPHFIKGRDLMIVACKIGRLQPDEITAELETIGETALTKAREALLESHQRGQDVLKIWAVDDDIRYFAECPECSEITAWLESELGQ